MIDTLTKTEKKTTRTTIERNYVLYPYPKSKVVLAKVITKSTDVKKGKPATTWYLFSQATYNKYQHRKAWTWIVNIGRDDLFAIMTTEYMDYYLSGRGCLYPDNKPRHVVESDWKKVLDIGDYGRVTRDQTWYDGMMYDPQGRPIRRAFYFDYITGGLRSTSYAISGVEKWLKRQKCVSNVKLISVPHYNRDSCNEEAVEFTFKPSRRIFVRMCKEKTLSTFELGEFVRKHLRVAKFEINQVM